MGKTKRKIIAYIRASTDKQDAIKTIGRLFGLCFSSSLLTGAHFNPNLFEAIHWLFNPENKSQDHIDEKIHAILYGYNYRGKTHYR